MEDPGARPEAAPLAEQLRRIARAGVGAFVSAQEGVAGLGRAAQESVAGLVQNLVERHGSRAAEGASSPADARSEEAATGGDARPGFAIQDFFLRSGEALEAAVHARLSPLFKSTLPTAAELAEMRQRIAELEARVTAWRPIHVDGPDHGPRSRREPEVLEKPRSGPDRDRSARLPAETRGEQV